MKSLLTLLFLIGLLYSPMVFSQDEEVVEEVEQKFTLSGSVDTYFHKSIGTAEMAPGTSFSNLNGFSLGMANLIAAYSGDKSGFVADLVFGPRGYDAVFGPTYTFPTNPPTENGQRIINQMYAYFKISDAVTLNLGQFNTFVGYEVISPTINVNYSCSYLFTNGPFNHTGLRADFDFGGGLSGKLAIMNPTDIVEFNPISTYTYGAQIGYTNDNGGAWLNFLYGDPDGTDDDGFGNFYGNLFQADLTTGWDFSDKFYLGANISLRSVALEADGADPVQFFGIALYPKYTISETFALGMRLENFQAKNGYPVVTPFQLDDEGNGSVTEMTLSGNIKIGDLTLIPEFRIDSMSEDTYTDKDNGDPKTQMLSLNFAAVYKF